MSRAWRRFWRLVGSAPRSLRFSLTKDFQFTYLHATLDGVGIENPARLPTEGAGGKPGHHRQFRREADRLAADAKPAFPKKLEVLFFLRDLEVVGLQDDEVSSRVKFIVEIAREAREAEHVSPRKLILKAQDSHVLIFDDSVGHGFVGRIAGGAIPEHDHQPGLFRIITRNEALGFQRGGNRPGNLAKANRADIVPRYRFAIEQAAFREDIGLGPVSAVG